MDAAQKFLQRRNEASEQQAENEGEIIPPILYRVYKSTVQKQVPNYLALSSYAVFLVLLDNESQVIAWKGSLCEEEDLNAAKELGLEILRRDYGHSANSIPIVNEQDDTSAPLTEAFLDIFDIDASLYSSKLTVTERRKPIENSSVSIGVLVPPKNLRDAHLFELKETSYAHPDAYGMVPRIPFPNLERNTIVYMNTGDQWDLWFSKNLPDKLIDLSIKFIENLIETQLSRTVVASYSANATDASSVKSLVTQYLQITTQGQERQCFRRALKIFTDFEPFDDIKTILDNRREEKEQEEIEAAKHYGYDPPAPSGSNNNNVQRAGLNPSNLNKKGPDMTPVINPKNATFWNNSAAAGRDSNGQSSGNHNNSNNANGKGGRLGGNNPMNENQDPQKKSPPAPQNLPVIGVNDINSVSSEMLEINDSWNIPLLERRTLLHTSTTSPDILLGWQIEIDDGLYAGVFVVIGTKKSLYRKTFFHLCAGIHDEFWIRLKRGSNKNGVAFRPLRKVVVVDANAPVSGQPVLSDMNEAEAALQQSVVKSGLNEGSM